MHLDANASAAGQAPQGVNAAECLQKVSLQGNTHCWLLEVQARMASSMHDRMSYSRHPPQPLSACGLHQTWEAFFASGGQGPSASAQGCVHCQDCSCGAEPALMKAYLFLGMLRHHHLSLLIWMARRGACSGCSQPLVICRPSMRVVGQEREHGLQQNLAAPPGGLLFQRSCSSHTYCCLHTPGEVTPVAPPCGGAQRERSLQQPQRGLLLKRSQLRSKAVHCQTVGSGELLCDLSPKT